MKVRGFTLVEAVLSIALLSVGLFGLLYSFHGSVSQAGIADQSYVAMNLARETLETIIARRDCNESGCGYSNTLTAIQSNNYNASSISGFSSYSLTATAVEVAPGTTSDASNFTTTFSGSGYAKVTVTVTFNNGSNSVELVTLISDYS